MAENLMTVAYENGVNLFDTAEVYASGRSDFTFLSWASIKLFFLNRLISLTANTKNLNLFLCDVVFYCLPFSILLLYINLVFFGLRVFIIYLSR